MNVRYRVTLTQEERSELRTLVLAGRASVRRIKRAQILLAAVAGSSDDTIATNVQVGTSTVYRTKRRFVEEGLEAALSEAPRPGAARKLSAQEEALLVARHRVYRSAHRSQPLDVVVARRSDGAADGAQLSPETIRRRLAENELKPWLKKMWCIQKVDTEFVARMEDVLELYAEPADAQRPVVCFDETPRQLIGESRVPVRAKPGQSARIDYEYVRNGTANVFVFLDVHRPWRHVKVTDRRAAPDFAHCMRELVDVHYPSAERVRVVLDNLSTHTAAALYETFEPAEARRILRRIEFHYTPKHASWLNMVAIEIGVMVAQCLDRRIPSKQMLISELRAWERRRNREKARIKWMFTVDRAHERLGRAYPTIARRPSRRAAV